MNRVLSKKVSSLTHFRSSTYITDSTGRQETDLSDSITILSPDRAASDLVFFHPIRLLFYSCTFGGTYFW